MTSKHALFLIFLLLLYACGGTKKQGNYSFKNTTQEGQTTRTPTVPDVSENPNVTTNSNTTAQDIIDTARGYEGTPYKFGGTTARGMDCSGLVHTAFNSGGVSLPRTARDMATKGKKINFQQISSGDLVFFKTNGSRSINHVGLVVAADAGRVYFIHASTSRGVIISSLDENYWFKAFEQARRVL